MPRGIPKNRNVNVQGEGTRRVAPPIVKGAATAIFYKDVRPEQLNEFRDRHPTAVLDKERSTHSYNVYAYDEAGAKAERVENEKRALAMIDPHGVALTDSVVIADSQNLESHMAQSQADAAATAARRAEVMGLENPFDKT